MSHPSDHITADNDRNEFPEYLLGKNQAETPANLSLFEAALRNDIAGVRKSIEDGGKVDFFHRKDDSKNALHVASESGYTHIVDTLIKHGAHVNAIAVSGHDTALTLCSHYGHIEVARMLLDNGADINAANCYGNSPLHEACHTGGSLELIALLISRGADVNAENHKGSTPLHFLCYGDDARLQTVSMAQELIKAGAEVNRRDHRGMNAILVCCSSGRDDLIQVLMSAGGDPTVRDNENRSAHAIAVFYSQESIAKQFAEDAPSRRFDHK